MSPEAHSFNQLNEQNRSGHKEMTVLVGRSGDKVSTGRYTGEKHGDEYVIEVTRDNGEKGYRTVPAEDLSDARQAELAEMLAGKPQTDEASVDTTPISELLADGIDQRVEHGESLSQNEVEELGHDALSAAGIEAPTEGETEEINDEETNEANAELPGAVHELVGTFIRHGGAKVEDLSVKTIGEIHLLDELKHDMNNLKYGDASNKQQLLQRQIDIVAELRGALQQDSGSELRTTISRYHSELEGEIEAIKKAEDTSEDLWNKMRLLRDASDEIEMNGRTIDNVGNELLQETDTLARTYDDYLQSGGWGDEMYLSLITQKLASIEESLFSRRARLSRIKDELPTLQNVTQ